MKFFFFFLLSLTFQVGATSFLELSASNRSQDLLCIHRSDIEKNSRVRQLVSIFHELSRDLDLKIFKENIDFDGKCLLLSQIPVSYQALTAEIITHLTLEQTIEQTNTIEQTSNNEKNKSATQNPKRHFKDVASKAGYTLGAQIASVFFMLYLLPPEFTRWGTNQAELFKNIPNKFKQAYTKPPVIDHDTWVANYVMHPWTGSMYYNALRSDGYTMMQSLLFATFSSTMWEYLVESIFERPSIQDLFITPIGGAIVGEAAHRATLAMKKNGFNTVEKIVITLFNPSYVLNNGYKSKE